MADGGLGSLAPDAAGAAEGVANRIVLAPLRREHIERVADLHCRALPGLFSALGPAATAAFYQGYLASARCVAFVDEHATVVRGFILGSEDPEGLRRDALRMNRGGILRAMALAALRRPVVLRHVVDSLAGLRGERFDSGAPELTYIAVRDDARGAGIGSVLLSAFTARLRERGATRYELSVEADNRAAVAFYEARGLRRLGTYRQFGTSYGRYAQELAAAETEGR